MTAFFVCILILALYFLPAVNAYSRKHNNRSAIFLTNVFFGWTILGWIITLIWSATGNVQKSDI